MLAHQHRSIHFSFCHVLLLDYGEAGVEVGTFWENYGMPAHHFVAFLRTLFGEARILQDFDGGLLDWNI